MGGIPGLPGVAPPDSTGRPLRHQGAPVYAVNCYRCGREVAVRFATFDRVLRGASSLLCIRCVNQERKSKSAATERSQERSAPNPSVRDS